MKMYTYTKFDSGLRDRYLLGAVENIFGGGGGWKNLWGGTKKTTEPLGGYQNYSTIGTGKNYIL
jgi:hypothetical protein